MGQKFNISVRKRPYVDLFLEKMSEIFELVFFTASIKIYADQIMDIIDPYNYCQYRLYRQDCHQIEGSYVKDLNDINRDIDKCIILDNSPIAYCLNPENAIPIRSWYSDKEDEELNNLIPILVQLSKSKSIKKVITTIISKLG